MRARSLALAALLLAGSAAQAQGPGTLADTALAARGHLLRSVTFGVPGYQREAVPQLATIGMHWTRARPHRIGSDVAIGTMPYGLIARVLVAGMRAGAALPIPIAPRTLLLPSAGMSGVVAMGGGGGTGAAGGYAGIGVAVRDRSGTGLRVGATWHMFNELGEPFWLLEVGFLNGARKSRERPSSYDLRRDAPLGRL